MGGWAYRFRWQIWNLPTTCGCGMPMSVDHALISHKGGYPSIRHNEICDLSAALLSEVCSNTSTEPGHCHSVARTWTMRQQIVIKKPGLTSRLLDFGEQDRMHLSTSGIFTQTHHPITTNLSAVSTANTRKKKRGAMVNVPEK